MIDISLRSKPVRLSVVAAELLVTFGLIAYVARAYVAGVFAETQTLKSLQAAVRLDPGNEHYHLALGRLYLYSATDLDLDNAAKELKRATELNPYDPQAWLDLAFALESQGNTKDAEACLRYTSSLAPNLPYFQWAIGNFFLLHGNVDETLRHFRRVLAGTSMFNGQIFTTAWKASSDAQTILDRLIPRQVSTELDYLDFLAARQQFPEARQVWARIAASSEKFSPHQTAAYIDGLIRARQPEAAYHVWSDLRNKGLIKPTYESSSRNLIENGDFEEDLLNMGFDWRIGGGEGAEVRIDEVEYHSPSHSLVIEFSGTQNVAFDRVFEFVPVSPGRAYRLRASFKTEGITTDSGPRLEARDVYTPGALDKYSDAVLGSSPGWTPVILDFKTGPKTELISVHIARIPSNKLDNKIAGKVWVDDITLTPE